ncbi:MAG: hypothetical protein JWR37_2088 [Mycobacterium sp.]|nr:hypothetical protein [Mycobacterium sp.]
MTTRRKCALSSCGAFFEARRSDAKFCSPRHRQQHFQQSARQPAQSVSRNGSTPTADAELVVMVRDELRAIGQLNSIDGQTALQLAEHLCRDTISGSERTSLTKSLNEAMVRAVRAADDDEPDAVDGLHAIRDAIRAGASADEVEAMRLAWRAKYR